MNFPNLISVNVAALPDLLSFFLDIFRVPIYVSSSCVSLLESRSSISERFAQSDMRRTERLKPGGTDQNWTEKQGCKPVAHASNIATIRFQIWQAFTEKSHCTCRSEENCWMAAGGTGMLAEGCWWKRAGGSTHLPDRSRDLLPYREDDSRVAL